MKLVNICERCKNKLATNGLYCNICDKENKVIYKNSFQKFCYKTCDGLYTPGIPDKNQSTGYLLLKKMIKENITPASLEEIKEWEENGNIYEEPNIKYLRFLHVKLRPFIIKNWNKIKNLKIITINEKDN